MTPVAASERVDAIDILRGAALFGILAANMRALGGPWIAYDKPGLLFPGFADRLVQGLLDVFVTLKFLSLFSFLFGLGFAVQMSRAEARGTAVSSFYPRRLLVLLLFGVLHGAFVFWGDILSAYAMMGLVLLAFRRRQQRTILRWATLWAATPGILVLLAFVALQFWHPPPFPDPDRTSEVHRLIAAVNEGSAADVVRENFRSWRSFVPRNLSVLGLLPAFLLGLWTWRSGIVQDLDGHEGRLRRVCRIALPLGLVMSCYAVAHSLVRGPRPPRPSDVLTAAALICGIYGTFTLAIGYASGLALLLRQDRWRQRLAPAAAVGRMALTNYLLQSLVCVPLFAALDLYGRVGPALLLIPTILLFAAQVWLSNRWLRRFQFGPMEWLWRGLTYGRLVPLRRPG